jgi:hypothetical protein
MRFCMQLQLSFQREGRQSPILYHYIYVPGCRFRRSYGQDQQRKRFVSERWEQPTEQILVNPTV